MSTRSPTCSVGFILPLPTTMKEWDEITKMEKPASGIIHKACLAHRDNKSFGLIHDFNLYARAETDLQPVTVLTCVPFIFLFRMLRAPDSIAETGRECHRLLYRCSR